MNKFDNLVECTRCGSDACYIQELTPEIKLDYCMGCGFTSSPIYKDSKVLNDTLMVLPTIYKILINQEEESGKIWIPSFVNIDNVGMIYANGRDENNWWWEAGKFNPKTPGKIKTEDLLRFDSNKGFIDALEFLGVIGGK